MDRGPPVTSSICASPLPSRTCLLARRCRPGTGAKRKKLTRGRVGPAGYPAGPPSEPHEPLIAAYGSSKPLG